MSYICKIATKEEMLKQFDYEISIHPESRSNWETWKEEASLIPEGHRVTYLGVLDGEVISEATAAITEYTIQNADMLVDSDTAYLFAFRTKKAYQGKGYFGILFRFMLDDLKKRGYKRVTIGVEPEELRNKAIYAHFGFNEYIKNAIEYEPDGRGVEVEFYSREL